MRSPAPLPTAETLRKAHSAGRLGLGETLFVDDSGKVIGGMREHCEVLPIVNYTLETSEALRTVPVRYFRLT
jgi:hypothetical protein